tara:strand:- start:681 stop:1142 length:462 start_codon:yes stop_codon:yes gene_type:complete
MNILKTFDIVPVPASRPKVTRWTTYYGKKYSKFREEMGKLTEDIKFIPFKGNIYAQLTFYIKIPMSWSKKKKKAKNGAYCDNNADIDNYCKAILDSLNGVYYEDDRQIVMLKAIMFWSKDPKIKCKFIQLDEQGNEVKPRLPPLPPSSPFENG